MTKINVALMQSLSKHEGRLILRQAQDEESLL